ncbi:MAG: MarR family transcriptional regulator [Luminiphilus sp.]|nr:MarR family transcriptional regulator [Luminiphilus sp.]
MNHKATATELNHESRVQSEDHQSIRLWLRLLTCTNMIEQRLRARLREEFATTLPRFDFMAQLERAPEGLTMGELSQRMMVSGGNVSGIANQLEGEGFIDRSPVPDNRRTLCVTLTEKGRGRFADMASAHEGWVVEMLGDLSQSEHQQIMKHLGQLKRGVSPLED